MAASTDFLGRISAEDREQLMKLARHRQIRKGEYVFRVGEVRPGVHFLLAGRLKFFRVSPSGREIILWFCFPGEIFGLSEMAEGKGRRVNVQACEDSELAVVPDAAFNRFLDGHFAASRLCRSVMTARLGILTNVLVNLVADDAHTRIAKFLLHLGARYGVTRGQEILLQIQLTHQEIANMTGVNRQTVTRVLGDLKRGGALRINNRRIQIESAELLNDVIRRKHR